MKTLHYYIYDGDCCADCCSAVEAIAPNRAVITPAQEIELREAVGNCKYGCLPSQTYRLDESDDDV